MNSYAFMHFNPFDLDEHSEAWDTMLKAYEGQENTEIDLDEFTDNNGIAVVIVEKPYPSVLGSATISLLADDPTTALISGFYIQREMRRKGLSRHLLEEILSQKLPETVKVVRIDCDTSNHYMIRIVKDYGFNEFYRSKSKEAIAFKMDYSPEGKRDSQKITKRILPFFNWKKYM